MPTQIAFIGAGRMASAIIAGLLENGHYEAGEIACTCGDDPSGPELAERTGIHYAADLPPRMESAATVVLACKPQQFDTLDPRLGKAAEGKLLLSILAGTPLARLREKFPGARNIVRTMPNTPGQIGAGVTAFAPLQPLPAEDRANVETILGSLGRFYEVPESQLDAVTALSGSGPAYVFEFAAALRDAGIGLGLDPDQAEAMAAETLFGAARLLRESGEKPEALRQAVTSPGGTTAAALEVLDRAGFRQLLSRVLTAARDRSIELAKG